MPALRSRAPFHVPVPRLPMRPASFGDMTVTLLAEPRELVVAEDVETGHHVDQVADVADHRIPEHQRLAVVVLLQALGDALDRLGHAPVEVAHRVVELGLEAKEAFENRASERYRRMAPVVGRLPSMSGPGS